jgi:hypothetical protein
MTSGQIGRWLAVAVVLAAGAATANAETVRCVAVKDVWVSSQPNEQDTSGGKTEVMKLKVLQEMGLIGFDVSALKGRQVKSAALYLHPQPQESKFVEGRPTELRWIVVSTISSPWVEGSQSKRGEPDPAGKGASYREASSGAQPWAWKGGTLSDVINGNLNSIFSVHELVPDEGGYWQVPVDAKVVEALVAGLGDGLSVMDGSGTHQANPFVFTREVKGKEPYLLVEVEGEKTQAPAAPEVLDVAADLSHATLDAGALVIQVRTAKDAIGLRVKVDGEVMEPWQVELPSPAGLTAVTLEDMPAGKEVKVAVAAVDAAGNESEWVEKTATVSEKVTVPNLPKVAFEPKAGEPKKVGESLVAWAFPEVVEVDPISAQPMFEKDKQEYRKANPVWSGKEGKVRLAAARGEIVAFQVALEQTGEPVNAEVSIELKNPAGQVIGANRVKLYRLWYVPSKGDAAAPRPRARANRRNRAATQEAPQTEPAAPVETRWNPEYLVPIAAGKVQVPMADNKVPGQKLQAVYVDIALPGDAQAGTWTGRVRVKAADGEASLPLEVVVYPVRIPAELNFNPELNTYSGPATAGSDAFYDWHRLAHYNRCTLNRVPYSQNGSAHEDMIPKLGGKGADTHVADWTEYDRRFGPLLTGGAFKGLPREGVPVKSFYLPLFENWPMRLEGHYEFGMPPKAEGRAQEVETRDEALRLKEKHDLTVRPIDQAFDEAYKEGFRKVTRQFVNHYDKKGWTRTLCQMYQNNKYHYRGQWWILDEPIEWSDWNALRFFASLFHQGIDTPHQARFLYRGDISRPQWQAGFMGGLMDIVYSGSAVGFANPRLLMHQKERDGMLVYIYGSCNPVERNSYESAAWCLKSFTVGGDGVLPWQSIGKDSSFDQPDVLGLLVSGKRFAMTAVPSMRVMALRHGAQQCELLKQVLDRNANWNRWHALALIQQKVPLEAVSNLRNVDQVTAAAFQAMTAENFLELKEGLLQMLSKGRGDEAPVRDIQANLPASGPQLTEVAP